MTAPKPHHLAERMIEAVRAGSRICRTVQSTLTAADSMKKDDKSPVTVADLATQSVIARRLADAFPEIPLVGEEDSKVFDEGAGAGLVDSVLAHVRTQWPGATEPGMRAAIDLGRAEGGAKGRFFTLDPIDGTKGFLRGGQYAIALALIEDGRIVAGVLGCPNLVTPDGATGAVLFAVRGGGTRLLALDGTDVAGAPARVSPQSDPVRLRLCESVDPGHTDQTVSKAILARLGVLAPSVRMDSQAKYGVLALGEGELYLRTPTKPGRSEWIWDHAAGVICVEESGGRVTDLDGNALDFGRGRTLSANRGIVATNGVLHDRVLAAVATA
jgi:HAL2 family 3'(2'),5'-bisphosphate nucleotidase